MTHGAPLSATAALTKGRLAVIGALADDLPSVARSIPPPDSWSLAPAAARLLAGLILDLPLRNVLEFGAGRSSLVIAAALAARGGGRLTSLEENPDWCAELWRTVEHTPALDARLVEVTPRITVERRGVFHRMDGAAEALPARGPFDFVLIDAPQYFYGREGALHLAWAHLAPGALVLLDDAARSGERRALRRWLATYPGLELVHLDPTLGSNGVALLRRGSDPTIRARAGVLIGSAVSALDGWRRWRGRRRLWKARRGEVSAGSGSRSKIDGASDR